MAVAVKDRQEAVHVDMYAILNFDVETHRVEAGYICWLDGEPNIEIKIDGITTIEDVPTVTAARLALRE